jgi:putative membrane protein
MFIDFLTLIMINLVAGTVLLAFYLWKGIDEKDKRPYASAFFATGLLSVITGLQMAFTWPLPGSYNIGYGDAATLFGIVYLATGLSLWQGWDLLPVTV